MKTTHKIAINFFLGKAYSEEPVEKNPNGTVLRITIRVETNVKAGGSGMFNFPLSFPEV